LARDTLSQAERSANLVPRCLTLTGDALGVDPQQHGHAVARPFSDLGGWQPIRTLTCSDGSSNPTTVAAGDQVLGVAALGVLYE
jgi:hypothetical protein